MTIQIIAHMFTILHQLDSSYVLLKPKVNHWRHVAVKAAVSADCHMCGVIPLKSTEIEIKCFRYL